MLTPKEVSEHAFAKAAFGGYSMAMVDEFLDAVTEDYTALYKENAALKAKMKVLVEKVEEYRSTEDGMRKTLLTAQNMADEMIRDAEFKRDQMLTRVEREARDQLGGLRAEVEQEQARLEAAKAATADYLAKVRAYYQAELQNLENIASEVAPAAFAAEPDPVADTAAEIESSMARLMEEEDEEDTLSFEPVADREEPEEEPAEAGEPDETDSEEEEDGEDEEDDDLVFARRLNMDDLRFGRDFDLN